MVENRKSLVEKRFTLQGTMISNCETMRFVADTLDEFDYMGIMGNSNFFIVAGSSRDDNCFELLCEAEIRNSGRIENVFNGFELGLTAIN